LVDDERQKNGGNQQDCVDYIRKDPEAAVIREGIVSDAKQCSRGEKTPRQDDATDMNVENLRVMRLQHKGNSVYRRLTLSVDHVKDKLY